MELFDGLYRSFEALLEDREIKKLVPSPFPKAPEKPFYFEAEAAKVLGAKECPSGYLYGAYEEALPREGFYLLGPDIKDLPKRSSFHRMSFFLLEKGLKNQALYRTLRNLEYCRYKVDPLGIIVRVNTNALREGMMVSKEAYEKGFSFAHLASFYEALYKRIPEVKGIYELYITDSSFPYEKANALSKEGEGMLLTLDHMLKNLTMDCASCSFKGICDAVEGMRERHDKN